ncbi:homeobox-domain-containing protein [Sistotremastrum suecicum HHB10207 ss-3]|uniref:Homeobox-domain-containing protein n=1 Tax=Sistotremastrum suecicum HHB10207 ss-3 TaxID=1314776 RepID=A0A166ID97_9AGAM|nr:homeobox-domain-containing protein [Sistotremastrum suecicum HHB10207 ss-3]
MSMMGVTRHGDPHSMGLGVPHQTSAFGQVAPTPYYPQMQQPDLGFEPAHQIMHPRPQSTSHRLPPLNIPDAFDSQSLHNQYPSHYPGVPLTFNDPNSPLNYYTGHDNQPMDSLRHRSHNVPLNPSSSFNPGHSHQHGHNRHLPPPFPSSNPHAPSINIPTTDWNMMPGSRDPYSQHAMRSPGAESYPNVDYGMPQGQTMAPEPTLKKKRKRADAYQLRILNDVYARTAFPSTDERNALARQLDMTPRSVQIWFQNKRQANRQNRYQPAPLASPTSPHGGPDRFMPPTKNPSPAEMSTASEYSPHGGSFSPPPRQPSVSAGYHASSGPDPSMDFRRARSPDRDLGSRKRHGG